jgi:hypothetical protein
VPSSTGCSPVACWRSFRLSLCSSCALGHGSSAGRSRGARATVVSAPRQVGRRQRSHDPPRGAGSGVVLMMRDALMGWAQGLVAQGGSSLTRPTRKSAHGSMSSNGGWQVRLSVNRSCRARVSAAILMRRFVPTTQARRVRQQDRRKQPARTHLLRQFSGWRSRRPLPAIPLRTTGVTAIEFRVRRLEGGSYLAAAAAESSSAWLSTRARPCSRARSTARARWWTWGMWSSACPRSS